MNVIYRGWCVKEVYLASLLYDSIEDLDYSAVVRLLRENQANPNVVLPSKGIAPFHLIVGNDDEEFAIKVTKLILQHGGNPNVRSDDGLTPLHIAAAWGRYKVVELLLASGGDPDLEDNVYKTALHYALDESHEKIVELIKVCAFDANICLEKDSDRSAYSVKFDKIEVNGDEFVEEYAIDEDLPERLLRQLPETDPNDYVSNWCDTHALNGGSDGGGEGGEVFAAGDRSSADSCETTTYESSDDSLLNVTLRKKSTIKKSDASKAKRITAGENRDKNATPKSGAKSTCTSKESGVLTTPDDVEDDFLEKGVAPCVSDWTMSKDKPDETISSDYLTCRTRSEEAFQAAEVEINNYEVTSDFSSSYNSQLSSAKAKPDASVCRNSEDLSYVTVSEVYQHVDEDEKVVLLEKHLLKNPYRDLEESVRTSILSTISDENTVDSDNLRDELKLHGFNPGPITDSTKKIYVRKLRRLRKMSKSDRRQDEEMEKHAARKTYSVELEKTVRNPNWKDDLCAYRKLEEVLLRQFNSPDPSRRWREGLSKTSFAYLLLDPRITDNLPCRAEFLRPEQVWENFLSAVFYVGKGKRVRPYAHLYDAVSLWKNGVAISSSKKLQRILDIWKSGGGVVCLHVFQNVIPVEAYTREAAMIAALKLENLSNGKAGDFYGIANTWSSKEKRMLGVFLLYKAMLIFINEGERQLHPGDVN